MSVVHSLMSLLEVIQPNSNVSMVRVPLVRCRYYTGFVRTLAITNINRSPTDPTPVFKILSGIYASGATVARQLTSWFRFHVAQWIGRPACPFLC